ncbi:sirohydrochlorin chelatase [Streptomyces sp. NPDC017260]|uniref:sirohydrochlorin chelatase n=1 Tax=unclassified Streptomyces TaxID=2593676 RepID=UPI0037AB2517
MTVTGRTSTANHPGGTPALVVVAHGSRDPRAPVTVGALLDRVRALRPALPVRLGHIELNEPRLPGTLAALEDGDAVLVPLLLSRGYHVKQDIPEMAAAAPARTRVAAPLGPHPLLVDALHDRLLEAGWPARAPRGGAVVLASAGSRDPESRADTARAAALLAGRLGVPVVSAYASAAAPTVPQAVRALTARGHRHVAVASYFTAPGRFATECAAAAPWIASAPLGTHPAMARLLLRRYDEAVGGRVERPATLSEDGLPSPERPTSGPGSSPRADRDPALPRRRGRARRTAAALSLPRLRANGA